MTVRIGYASGVYDLFHIGHLNLLKHARSQCDYLIAGVASTDMTQRLKGTTPVVPLAERVEIVRSVRYVDDVVVDEHLNKAETWREVGFNVFFKGDDWRGTEKGDRLERDMARIGVQVVYFPYTVSTSSTVLRRALTLLEGGRAGDAALNA
ncbi:adenylyltransferase/cytidyltransferase family protein [Arthrobacter sp. G119Y2]|uniref:adenylyltransferase/cytidyltransferase family protein n=1 Tax=Arthrobacter sp. G119Y2 TaxID=3134965 RepID=UPI00311A704C